MSIFRNNKVWFGEDHIDDPQPPIPTLEQMQKEREEWEEQKQEMEFDKPPCGTTVTDCSECLETAYCSWLNDPPPVCGTSLATDCSDCKDAEDCTWAID